MHKHRQRKAQTCTYTSGHSPCLCTVPVMLPFPQHQRLGWQSAANCKVVSRQASACTRWFWVAASTGVHGLTVGATGPPYTTLHTCLRHECARARILVCKCFHAHRIQHEGQGSVGKKSARSGHSLLRPPVPLWSGVCSFARPGELHVCSQQLPTGALLILPMLKRGLSINIHIPLEGEHK